MRHSPDLPDPVPLLAGCMFLAADRAPLVALAGVTQRLPAHDRSAVRRAVAIPVIARRADAHHQKAASAGIEPDVVKQHREAAEVWTTIAIAGML